MIRRAFLARMAWAALALGVVRYEMPEIESEPDIYTATYPRWKPFRRESGVLTEWDIQQWARAIEEQSA